ncbi:hypothetical protein NPIL_479321 [Nephila pilipes]|uniref:Secreted protein n=1 Tax=Nephila pilipes TaxID=299642 RepID=A0A8X6NGX5_NEPPI|nr:hypothetical protein NPIL_479321 [Nephila pilipes]
MNRLVKVDAGFLVFRFFLLGTVKSTNSVCNARFKSERTSSHFKNTVTIYCFLVNVILRNNSKNVGDGHRSKEPRSNDGTPLSNCGSSGRGENIPLGFRATVICSWRRARIGQGSFLTAGPGRPRRCPRGSDGSWVRTCSPPCE